MVNNIFQNAMAATFRNEINDAITEDLFETAISGFNSFLLFPKSHPRLKYYVSKRYDPLTGQMKEQFSAERDFYELYWPRKEARSKQILILKGCEGVGKSTFLQYFFRFFLPYYNEQAFYNEIQEGPKNKWIDLCLRHVVLRANLHRVNTIEEMYQTIFDYFTFQLTGRITAENGPSMRYANSTKTYQEYKSNIKYMIDRLAWRTCTTDYGIQRQFFTTWIFDNMDLMSEDLQLELLNYAIKQVQEETPKRNPYDPIESTEHRLWKIILPVRPETYDRLLLVIKPFGNKEEWPLDPLCRNELAQTRGNLLQELIRRTDRQIQEIMELKQKEIKPPLKLTEASVAGRTLKESFQTKLTDMDIEGEFPVAALHVYDDLVNGSARRYLLLRRRLTMSRTVNSRLARGRRYEWKRPSLSPFYFLDGLLCGESGIYNAVEEDNLILNLYDMGANTADCDPYSLLVGVHLISLLKREADWNDNTQKLLAIGYTPNDIDRACSRLIQKSVMKLISTDKHGTSHYQFEMPIIKAHWRLLCERAYTDNVTISLGKKLGLFGKSINIETDCLDYADFFKRVKFSIAFLRCVLEAQDKIRNPDTAKSLHQKDDNEFRDLLQNLRLPDVYKYVSSEYRTRVEAVLEKQVSLREWLRIHDQLYDVFMELGTLPKEFDEASDILIMAKSP